SYLVLAVIAANPERWTKSLAKGRTVRTGRVRCCPRERAGIASAQRVRIELKRAMPTLRVLRRTDDRNGERQMSLGEGQSNLLVPFLRMLARRDVLAGLLFIAVAALGLWLSRDYPIGTALRMGTGYVPRLLCWLLLGLGVIVLVQGLREAQDARPLAAGDISALRPVIFVTASLVIFGLSIERL